MSDTDIVKEFLQKSYENLYRLDRKLVGLEIDPRDVNALVSVFRTIHTIEGTCSRLRERPNTSGSEVESHVRGSAFEGKVSLECADSCCESATL
jgi:two-component system chemotaxis sensor kinase CheA